MKIIIGLFISAFLLAGCGAFKSCQVNIVSSSSSVSVTDSTLFKGLLAKGGTIKISAAAIPVTGQLIYTAKVRVKRKAVHTLSTIFGPGSF